ncbi:hypothetical protein, variant [Verruconis gallopava]|uniref:Uncharacterized protein n=1 Tax=Verruconis gallopava TaxID=253628 RepID=A0A0D2B7F0_9PEZI|nr:hypothetical protein, variant [Verruconis gallopava]KIW07179.1 hypothetical protein, variant [Verruconis gallopava]
MDAILSINHKCSMQHYDKTKTAREKGSLISASLITVDFDALRFDAAASLQVLPGNRHIWPNIPRSYHLISSPYNDANHLLDIRTLDTQCCLLAQALTFLKPIRADYATADYLSSFNWTEVLSILRLLAKDIGHTWTSRDFYTVIFRSQLNAGVDQQRLHDLDKTSHLEAVASGQLLKYWFGKRDEHERNLATCIWRSKEDARLGGLGPNHKRARMAAKELYNEIKFSTWRLIVDDDAKNVKIEEWKEK